MKILTKTLLLLIVSIVSFTACDKDEPVNIFPLEQDKSLGLQLKLEIEGNPAEYPLLPEAGNDSIYKFLRDMRDSILNSGVVKYKDDFAWGLKIIQDDSTLNAFCAPGGYMYVYTGLIKYLDTVDHLAGVLAHEIAHADQRHSTSQMTTQYGIDVLLTVATGSGSQSQIAEMAKGLTMLGFSRSHETDADNHSVEYLCNTKYAADGAAGFFEKLEANNMAGTTPAFLSTHPSPSNRIENINAKAAELGCNLTPSEDQATFLRMKALLP